MGIQNLVTDKQTIGKAVGKKAADYVLRMGLAPTRQDVSQYAGGSYKNVEGLPESKEGYMILRVQQNVPADVLPKEINGRPTFVVRENYL